MNVEKIKINNTELNLVFDKVDLPFQDKDLKITKIICYFNFKEPNGLIIGEIILENSRVKLFDFEEQAKDFALEFIENKFRSFL